MGRRLVARLGQRSLGVVNPLTQTPTHFHLKVLVDSGFGGSGRKAD
jgi:hypothetical protein